MTIDNKSTSEEQRIAVRDLLAETIDTYMMSGGEYREYDLADRIQKALSEHGWWVKWGAQIAHLVDKVDALYDGDGNICPSCLGIIRNTLDPIYSHLPSDPGEIDPFEMSKAISDPGHW